MEQNYTVAVLLACLWILFYEEQDYKKVECLFSGIPLERTCSQWDVLI